MEVSKHVHVDIKLKKKICKTKIIEFAIDRYIK